MAKTVKDDRSLEAWGEVILGKSREARAPENVANKAKMNEEQQKYGVVVDEILLFPEDARPFRIAVIEHDDDLWLDYRHMWKSAKTGELKYGKGARIRFSDADTVISVMEQLYLRQEIDWVEE